MPDSKPVLAHTADLLFAARMRGAASAAGTHLTLARSAAEFVEQARTSEPRLLIIDLDTRALDAVQLIATCKADPQLRAIPLLAYVSHVREDLIESARTAGADQVIARGAFARNLPQILSA